MNGKDMSLVVAILGMAGTMTVGIVAAVSAVSGGRVTDAEAAILAGLTLTCLLTLAAVGVFVKEKT